MGSQILRSRMTGKLKIQLGKLKNQLDLDFGQPMGSQVLRSRMTGKLKNQLNLDFGSTQGFPSAKVQND
jgi:uncharacterized protein (UPF0262 family)